MSASDKKKLRKEQYVANLTEKQQKELKETKKLKTYTLTFAIIMLLVVAIIIGVSVRSPIMSAVNKKQHAVTIGEHKLSTVDFTYYYVDAINKHYYEVYKTYSETLGNYWAMFLGYNLNTPLNEQIHDKETNTTWADYFVDQAIDSATTLYALYDLAVEDKHELTNEDKTQISTSISNLRSEAAANGYSDVEDYLRLTYCDGANLENYAAYVNVQVYANSYFQKHRDSLEYAKDVIDAYNKEHYDKFSSFTYAFYSISVSKYLGEGTKDADGKVTYTDEQKENALAAAKKEAEKLVASGATTTLKFNEAIKALDINKDNKNAACTTGEDVFYDDIAATDIQKWLVEEGRKVNDIEAVPIYSTEEGKSDEIVGYLVILFQGRNDNLDNLVTVRHIPALFEGYYYDAEYNLVVPDSSKANAQKKANSILDEWKKGAATENSFAELADKNTSENETKKGGLQEDVFPGSSHESINKWCFEEGRKPGDVAILDSEVGYHIIYFVKQQDSTYRDLLIETEMRNEDADKWLENLKKEVKAEKVNLSGIELDIEIS